MLPQRKMLLFLTDNMLQEPRGPTKSFRVEEKFAICELQVVTNQLEKELAMSRINEIGILVQGWTKRQVRDNRAAELSTIVRGEVSGCRNWTDLMWLS